MLLFASVGFGADDINISSKIDDRMFYPLLFEICFHLVGNVSFGDGSQIDAGFLGSSSVMVLS